MTPSPVFVDFESRSRVKLRDVGGRKYWEHPSSEVVCAVLRQGVESVLVSPLRTPHDLPTVHATFDTVCTSFKPSVFDTVIAHNGTTFDRFAWRRLGWPEPRRWIDTSYLARVAGYPQADLDWLATNLLGEPKDLEGSKLTKSLSQISRAAKTLGQFKEITPEILERVIKYCCSDVDQLARLYEQYLQEWEDADLPGYEVAQIAGNDRGICFDVELAKDLLEADDLLAERACAAATVSRALVRSNAQLRAEFARRGCPVPNAQAPTFDALLLDPEAPEPAKALARARQASNSIAAGKLRAGLARVSEDGRLRDNTRIYGAHTGRESGQGMQLQNLAKGPALDLESTLLAFERGRLECIDPAGKARPLDGKAVNTLLRGCLKAKPGHRLLVCDWSQIEARLLAWAAEDVDALRVFRLFDSDDKVNGDPYLVAASRIFGCSIKSFFGPDGKLTDEGKLRRQIGKVAVLGLGYQMGAVRFEDFAASAGADWAALYPLTPADVVRAWRQLHEPIVGFWHETQRAAIEVTQGPGFVDVGPFTWGRVDGVVMNRLPSGRVIVYRGMRVAWETNEYGKKKPSLRYSSRKGPEHTFGGKLTENCIQAAAACLLRRAVVECERRDLNYLLSVHDEIICEVPKDDADEGLDLLKAIMCDVPDWAEGLPLAVTGFHTERYRKE